VRPKRLKKRQTGRVGAVEAEFFNGLIGPDGQAMAAVNARCLEDIDASALPVQHYDGRNA
ncbi:hypothetical protein QOU18_10720, partial [Pseudomonas aeruginosa]